MRGTSRVIAALGSWLAALVLAGAAPMTSAEVVVDAGPYDRENTPIVASLPKSLAAFTRFVMTPVDGGGQVHCQVLTLETPALAWVLSERLPAGATRRYRIEAARGEADSPYVGVVNDGERLKVKAGPRALLDYQWAVAEPPQGIEALYRRSGQIHPLRTPSGRDVTDDFPPDHAHQHGVFFAWVNTTFDGHKLDFWNQKEKTGAVGHADTLGVEGGPICGQFRVQLRHDDVTSPGAPHAVLNETWTVRAYKLADVTMVDLESRQSCAGDKPLSVNTYHYGGFGLRGNRAWFDPEVKGNARPDPARSGRSEFLTSEGKHRRDGNHTRPRWVDLSGAVDGAECGVAVLDHPANFRFPQPVRLHPNKPYFCFAPMVLGGFSISPGTDYVSRYRLIAHDGAPDAPSIDRLWRDYAEPPHVRIVPEP